MRLIFETVLEGDGASAASHDIGASNEIENFEQSLDMLRVPLVIIMARDVQLKVFDQAVEKLGGALVTILARGLRLKIFSCNVTTHSGKISPWLIEQIFNRIYRANSVTSGTHNTSKACIVQKHSIAHLAP